MNRCATDWEVRSLASLATYLNGFAFKPQHWGSHGLPIIRIRELLDPSVEPDRYDGPLARDFIIQNGDLIFSWSATLAAVVWDRGPAYLNQHLFKVSPASDVDARFLNQLINFHLDRLSARSHGTTMRHVTRGDLAEFMVELPKIAEQAQIANVLEAVDRQIELVKHVVVKLEAVRRGQVADLLAANDVVSETVLGELANVASGVTLGAEPRGPGTVRRPYLRVANVQDGHLDLAEMKFVRVRVSDLARFTLAPGDVLLNEGGDADKLGRGAVWHGEIPDCLHQNHVFRVRCNENRLDPAYLSIVTGSPFGKRYFMAASKQTTNLASINSSQIKAFPVPLRSIESQGRIVEAVRSTEALLSHERAAVAKLKLLRSGLAAALLTGRVRVPTEVTA